MKKPEDLPIKPEEWEATPLSVQTVVVMLWEERQIMAAQITQLHKQVIELQMEIKRLQEQAGKNSQNSSKPPSSDPPGMKLRPPRDKKGRKAGGQPGHRGRGRKHKPLECVDQVIIQMDRCQMIRFTTSASIVIFDRKDRVLLSHRRDLDIWNLPGGGVETGESPQDALIRNTRDNTGLKTIVTVHSLKIFRHFSIIDQTGIDICGQAE